MINASSSNQTTFTLKRSSGILLSEESTSKYYHQQTPFFFCLSVECLRTIWVLVVSLTLRRKHFSLTGKFLRWSNAAGCQMLVGSNEMHHTRYKNRYFKMPHVPIIACCIHITCGGVPFHESVHCIEQCTAFSVLCEKFWQ